MSNPPDEPMTLKTVGVTVPASFPAAAHNATNDLVWAKRPKHDATPHFASAWNAGGLRFHAVNVLAAQLDESLTVHGTGPPPLERARQEHALFALYGNALSAAECTAFAAFAVGAMVNASGFPMATEPNLRDIMPKRTLAAFRSAFPNDPISEGLKILAGGGALDQISAGRNILSHRGAPPRHHNLHVGAEGAQPTTLWALTGQKFASGLGVAMELELGAILTTAINAIHLFAQANL